MNAGQELGVQSFCFRNFKDNAKTAELVKECGLSKIELCGVHVDFDDPATFGGVIETYRDAGVEIVSIGVSGMSGDEGKERDHFEFCKACGAKFMAVSFSLGAVPECFRVAEKLSAEYDVLLGIHNHGGGHWLGSTAALDWVFDNTDDRIGLCLDTAWALDARQDPVAMAEKFADRLYGVHIKDFIFDRAGKPEDVVVGTGNLELKKLVDAMGAANFAGAVVLEYEGDVEDPVPALTKCTQAVREVC